MGHFFFYLAVVAACLLWSAAFTAAAARTRPGWIRWVLIAAAAVVPILALAPWLVLTATLAFRERLQTNWFGPTLAAFVSAVGGGIWIVRSGLSRSAAAPAPVAVAWPVVALAGGFVLAKAVAFGTLLFIDNAVSAEGRMLRVEAAQMIAATMPPAPAADDDAAPLYQRVFAALAADKGLADAESPATKPLTADVDSPEVAAILERHAATLELLRRAADKPGCRFARDWARPSMDMVLPEVAGLRQATRLLALAALREAAAGDVAPALADVVRIRRVGLHAAAEPILICGLVGAAIDTLALETLGRVLPAVGRQDAALLDDAGLRDLVETPISFHRHVLGEEAFGLATMADLADGRYSIGFIRGLAEAGGGSGESILLQPFSLAYRCFLLPADVAGYRGVMRRYQGLVGSMAEARGRPFPEIRTETDDIERSLEERHKGIFTTLMAPALGAVMSVQAKNQALHRSAEVLVAATRARLATGSLPDSIEALVPAALPAIPSDPFTTDQPLRAKPGDDSWSVWSVGPDGEDDGGPPAPGVEKPEANDDVGLRMAGVGRGE